MFQGNTAQIERLENGYGVTVRNRHYLAHDPQGLLGLLVKALGATGKYGESIGPQDHHRDMASMMYRGGEEMHQSRSQMRDEIGVLRSERDGAVARMNDFARVIEETVSTSKRQREINDSLRTTNAALLEENQKLKAAASRKKKKKSKSRKR